MLDLKNCSDWSAAVSDHDLFSLGETLSARMGRAAPQKRWPLRFTALPPPRSGIRRVEELANFGFIIVSRHAD